MKPAESKTIAQATLFETYAPIERYWEELRSRIGAAPAPRKLLPAEDAYLLRLLAAGHNRRRAVLDLAGPSTWGATTLLWTTQGNSVRVYAPALEGLEAWESVCHEHLKEHSGSSSLRFLPHEMADASLPEMMSACDAGNGALMVVLPASEDSQQLQADLEAIFRVNSKARVVLVPLGLLGEDSRLGTLLTWTASQELTLTALRDLSPCLAMSRLGVIGPAADVELQESLKRIGRLFTSNFDFLTLAHDCYTTHRANTKLEAQVKEATAARVEIEKVMCERDRELAEARHRIRELDMSAVGWSRECERMAAHAMWLEDQLRAATRGRGWSLVQRLRSLKQKLIPNNSFRERCGKLLMRTQRRLRGAA